MAPDRHRRYVMHPFFDQSHPYVDQRTIIMPPLDNISTHEALPSESQLHHEVSVGPPVRSGVAKCPRYNKSSTYQRLAKFAHPIPWNWTVRSEDDL